MGGRERPPKEPPKFDLAELRKLLPTYVLRGGVIDRAMEFLGTADRASTIPIMKAALASLTADDFYRGHTEMLRGRGAVRLDDYVKLNEYGLWFFKIDIVDGLVVHSCHESREIEVRLYNGNILRRPDE